MKKLFNLFVFIVAIQCLYLSCATKNENYRSGGMTLKQSNLKKAPVAPIKPKTFSKFGKTRIDNYYWLKDKNDPNVIAYLNEENAYTDEAMASTKDLQDTIYKEIIGRIKEDDEGYPVLKNGYYYYHRTEKGKQYATYCRKKDLKSNNEEILFDVNKMAEGKSAFIFRTYSISPDNTKAMYLYNETGSYAEFTLKIKDLMTGKDSDFSIDGVASIAWANDNNTIFYSKIDGTLRSSKIFRRAINEKKANLVYEEKDVRFSTYVSAEKTRQFIFISNVSSTTSESLYVNANRPNDSFKVFVPRVKDTDYGVGVHKECFFITYKDKENLNSKVYTAPLSNPSDKSLWKEFFPHNKDVRIEDIDILDKYVVLDLRINGLIQIKIKRIDDGKMIDLSFPEPVYNAYSMYTPEYSSEKIRYGYSSLNRPATLYEYDIKTGKTVVLKEQEVPSGFTPSDYKVERLWATAKDGIKVPIAIVYKKGLKKNGSNPTLLYSYGSYGHSSDVYFSPSFYSLIDRGFVFAIAQIRGGSDLGEQWYEDGKLLKKKNTFTDFIACSEHLIKEGYTSPNKLAIMGGSAGGLLMGAVTNMRPDLFHAVVAQVPFVDVVTTMLDDSLPLTTGEYEEWGNPNEEEYFNYMLSYSPYDNIEKKDYPNILITGGLNDSQVLFHEPTKYVAKLRANKTDDNVVLLHLNMDSGHGGATGRYDSIKDMAFEFAFILSCF